jgi:hypothetical protein
MLDSGLSKPPDGVALERLFTPAYAAERMREVLSALTPKDAGGCFAWYGSLVPD